MPHDELTLAQIALVESITARTQSVERSQREQFVAEQSGGDEAVRREVVVRLCDASETRNRATLQSDDAFFDAPSPPPARVGHYTIKKRLDSGGMGTVYLAQQESPRRVVALKVMKRGIASRSALRRFEYESQILARLRHPNVAHVYEAGTHDDGKGGVPYFAMEYVPNAKTITEYASQKQLGTRERLELFAKVCDAVHHGHQKGVIHRDLKPGNILVDANGEPKIIDFGVARSTDSDMVVTTLQTDIGQLIGTLQYMSPEQCEADPHDLDTRSDVYALGVVLYELLCDQLPYDISSRAIHEVARVIREEHPTRLNTISRTLRGDIETIALKALEKERQRRYQAAGDLGRDIQRYLHDEPIEARPPSASYQIVMYMRRHKATASAIVMSTAILVIASFVSVIFGVKAQRALNDRDAALEAEVEQKQIALNRLSGANWQLDRIAWQLSINESAMVIAGSIPGAAGPEVEHEVRQQLDESIEMLEDMIEETENPATKTHLGRYYMLLALNFSKRSVYADIANNLVHKSILLHQPSSLGERVPMTVAAARILALSGQIDRSLILLIQLEQDVIKESGSNHVALIDIYHALGQVHGFSMNEPESSVYRDLSNTLSHEYYGKSTADILVDWSLPE